MSECKKGITPQELINISSCQYIAMDRSGYWYFYEYRPNIVAGGFSPKLLSDGVFSYSCGIYHINIEYEGKWRDSLHKKQL